MEDIESLRQELFAPVRTFRLFAIENILRSKAYDYALELLIERLDVEDDSECELLLRHAIRNIEERRSTAQKDEAIDFEEAYKKYFTRKPSSQLAVIERLSEKNLLVNDNKLSLSILLEGSSHPVVTAQIVKKFSRAFSEDKISFLKQHLFDKSMSLRLACLEALVKINPSELKDSFKRLVLSKEPLIRALAIRGLAKTSPIFASEFLAEFLEKSDRYGKLAAIRVCSVIDFTLIKNSILNILIKETDEKLLNIAGSIILTNPDKEMPFRLYNLLENISGEKKVLINGILKKYCAILKATGICGDYDKYILNLKEYVATTQTKNRINSLLDSYDSSSIERKVEIKKLLLSKMKTDKVIDNTIRVWLLHNSESQFNLEKIEPESYHQKIRPVVENDDEVKLDDLGTLSESDQRNQLQKVFDGNQVKLELKVIAFNFAINNSIDGFEKQAVACLAQSSDELTAVAFEYLAIFDKDTFLLKMRRFATSDSLLVRTVLIRKASKDFPEEAKSLLNSMLSGANIITRKKALGAVIHFEFSFIKPVLINFLKRESDEELVAICLVFFQTNPLIESVYDLKTIASSSKYSNIFAETISNLGSTLKFLNIASEEEIELYVAEREKQEKERLVEEKHNRYLQEIRQKIDWSTITNLNEDGQITKLFFSLIILALLIVGLLYLTGDKVPVDNTPTNKIVFKPLIATVQEYNVTVLQLNTDHTILVMSQSGKKLMLKPRFGRQFNVFPGDEFVLTGMPCKISSDGIIVIKTISLVRK